MMANKPTNQDTFDEMIRNELDTPVPPRAEARMRARLADFRGHLTYRDVRMPVSWQHRGLRVAGAFALALALVLAWSFTTGEGPEPTWADVAERFAESRFLSATIYVKADAAASPVQLELWVGQGGRLRMRAGHEVFFGERGRLDESVAVTPPRNEAAVAEAREMVQEVIATLGAAEAFSLETLVQALPFRAVMSTPLPNQNARLAEDMLVFDMTDADGPGWLRVWVLRESQLPVRMRYWDPRNGQSVDASLSYAHDQPPAFFDAEAFKAALGEGGAHAPGQAYALLKDPGGRPVTPDDIETK